ncbi:T9SS C-terminal target domain-containing protein [Prevotella copri]|uniref:T9SS type A sorting domain-containing protein n=1 Tax=Segatella copri TaxID=165179 RepID=UPI0019321396|nr:T9SS type A sorting domain-containing protein [Segatella copri]MBM0264721.1 T9SS C-terminal target domain-containing protein [Segatella copri]
MRRIVLSLLLVLSCFTSKAADGKSLFVTFKDGQKIEFALTTMPEICFGNNLMTITSTRTTASYELWKVNIFTYGTTTGISQLPTSSKFSLEEDRIIVDGTNNKINAFALDGKAIGLSHTTAEGKTIINLNALTHGVYIIKINNKSIKVARQ